MRRLASLVPCVPSVRSVRVTPVASLVPLALAGLVALAPGASAATPGAEPATALTVTVSDPSGSVPSATYELRCAPAGGTHPRAAEACDRLGVLDRDGADPFAPVPAGRMCTQIYGGPATAHITGTWRGRAVDAAFDRRNGCETARWHALVPVLPSLG
ncbi:SSI family serine proteinase inhibitor [Streptomyces sp. NRRL F-5126]|uniref:SSI family serine proteinase inhibitor n=1 Tax=Streptomyces sp. NRRL F-5126 TaxID=1463857 RepID=UPI0018FE0DC3|nr:SSI family serine proteinase inhibitor [Streptomyces sp. NRRL F-5126]